MESYCDKIYYKKIKIVLNNMEMRKSNVDY